jgi:hypothetical protein
LQIEKVSNLEYEEFAKQLQRRRTPMERFIHRFQNKVIGTLSGFDRLVFRGTLRRIAYLIGMKDFVWHNKILWKDFGNYAEAVSKRLKERSLEIAAKQGREYIYLYSGKTDKEAIARKLIDKHNIEEGLIGILGSVELCKSYYIYPNTERNRLELGIRQRKCLHLYHYMIDPEFGFLNARIQTWFPFNIQICINGREWLARQMDRIGLQYERKRNCFPWIEDVSVAQKLMNTQLKLNWAKKLKSIAALLNPTHNEIFDKYPIDYYWSTFESEWATDVMFQDISSLQEIYPGLVMHALTQFSSPDVMRFLGKKMNGSFNGEIITSCKERPEGVRVKHWIQENSIKLYDKWNISRVETTINNPFRFKVYRRSESDPQSDYRWRPLRKGVADLHRWTQISQASNERYFDSLAAADTSKQIGDIIKEITVPKKWKGKSVRALRPWDQQDLALLQAINRGEFAINGFRNRDLQPLLFNKYPVDQKEKVRRRSRISRLFLLLRAHHIIQKVPRTYRYVISPRGAQILTAILATNNLTLDQLNKAIA